MNKNFYVGVAFFVAGCVLYSCIKLVILFLEIYTDLYPDTIMTVSFIVGMSLGFLIIKIVYEGILKEGEENAYYNEKYPDPYVRKFVREQDELVSRLKKPKKTTVKKAIKKKTTKKRK